MNLGKFATFSALLAAGVCALAGNFNWSGAGEDGLWATEANWAEEAVPNAADATIEFSQAATIDLGGAEYQISAFTNTAAITIKNGTLTSLVSTGVNFAYDQKTLTFEDVTIQTQGGRLRNGADCVTTFAGDCSVAGVIDVSGHSRQGYTFQDGAFDADALNFYNTDANKTIKIANATVDFGAITFDAPTDKVYAKFDITIGDNNLEDASFTVSGDGATLPIASASSLTVNVGQATEGTFTIFEAPAIALPETFAPIVKRGDATLAAGVDYSFELVAPEEGNAKYQLTLLGEAEPIAYYAEVYFDGEVIDQAQPGNDPWGTTYPAGTKFENITYPGVFTAKNGAQVYVKKIEIGPTKTYNFSYNRETGLVDLTSQTQTMKVDEDGNIVISSVTGGADALLGKVFVELVPPAQLPYYAEVYFNGEVVDRAQPAECDWGTLFDYGYKFENVQHLGVLVQDEVTLFVKKIELDNGNSYDFTFDGETLALTKASSKVSVGEDNVITISELVGGDNVVIGKVTLDAYTPPPPPAPLAYYAQIYVDGVEYKQAQPGEFPWGTTFEQGTIFSNIVASGVMTLEEETFFVKKIEFADGRKYNFTFDGEALSLVESSNNVSVENDIITIKELKGGNEELIGNVYFTKFVPPPAELAYYAQIYLNGEEYDKAQPTECEWGTKFDNGYVFSNVTHSGVMYVADETFFVEKIEFADGRKYNFTFDGEALSLVESSDNVSVENDIITIKELKGGNEELIGNVYFVTYTPVEPATHKYYADVFFGETKDRAHADPWVAVEEGTEMDFSDLGVRVIGDDTYFLSKIELADKAYEFSFDGTTLAPKGEYSKVSVGEGNVVSIAVVGGKDDCLGTLFFTKYEPQGEEDWDNPAVEITKDTTAAEAWPSLADSALANAKAEKLQQWASENSVAFAGVATNELSVDAFLLNCALDKDAVAAAKAAFAFLEVVPGSIPEIDASKYNGTVTIKGSTDLKNWDVATDEDTFFKAELDF